MSRSLLWMSLSSAVLLTLAPAGPAQPAVPKPYQAAVRMLEDWIAFEMAEKNIPALGLALVDDQTVVLARGFGKANSEDNTHAGPATVYRVGSVSKPVTAL